MLDFVGVTKQSKVYHRRLPADPEKVITQTFIYDHQNRLLVHKHQVDTNPEEILVQNEYNEISQLKNRKLGGTNPAQPLQNIDYTYNIRGWLTKINDPSNLNGKLFGYEMKYTNPVNSNVAPGKFSGTITEVDWKNASEDVLKRYNYAYDGLGRLKDAVYSEPNATVPFNNNYNEHVTYDLNGNIKSLKRNAFPASGSTTSTQVDDMVYNYTGNRLTKVTENALNDTGYEGGNNIISYDQNGNMKDILDKGIQSVQYNFLNLSNGYSAQQSDEFGLKLNSTMSYLYRADGTKLRKTYSSAPPRGSVTTRITDYLDGFQYSYTEGGGICLECRTESAYEQQAYKNASLVFPGTLTPEWKLDFVSTAAGYYSFTENRYIYQYRDHLGNARVTFAKNSTGVPEIIDTNNYYPFGLNHISGSYSTSGFGSFYSYKYNGKELQETGLFDYGWRQYLPDLGRWNGIDQLAESYLSTSPYAYVANNPVSNTDPDGRWINEDGSIRASTTFDYMPGSYKPMYSFSASTGMSYNSESGGGGSGYLGNSYDFIGKDAVSMFNYFKNGGSMSGLSFGDTEITWYTGTATQEAYRMGDDIFSDIKLGIIHKARIANYNPIAYGELADRGFNWIQNHPREVSAFAGIIQSGSTIAEKGLANWSAPSNIAKSRIFAEIISTRLPISAKALETTSTALKWGGRVVGAVGLANTLYQYGKGNISGTRAIVDGVMGVAGFFPATAWVSVVYFAGMAFYETYGNDGKPLF
ncbi:RHS repeat-associated core domain-containing protein [Chryseobacterium sp.]|uniref:RHS repeat-associated core domain-containing protein n=1 Tax=Chryseobacterium sp. TaxID=1871047 RepID=UPI0035AE1351